MKCPVDGTTLAISNRSGVEIDYCPDCRGVWLDRGELDKIIDRDASTAPTQATEPRYSEPPRDSRHYEDHSYKKKRKESFLGDLFDF